MLIRVWGEINGIGAMPMFNIGDKYYFQPPQSLTGRYVCSFWAEDDFGNITNEVAVLTIFQGMVKCIEVLTREWAVTMLSDTLSVDATIDTFDVRGVSLTALEPLPDGWVVKVVPFECRDNMVEVMI